LLRSVFHGDFSSSIARRTKKFPALLLVEGPHYITC
jgi:hypothetical protein